MRRATRKGRDGFTLIELLVVIAIIAVLVGLLLPAIQKVREFAMRVSCQSNLRQIGTALHTYHTENNYFPPGSVGSASNIANYYNVWTIELLPYVEQTALYSGYKPALLNWDTTNPGQATVRQTGLKVYTCPSDPDGNQLVVPESGNGGQGAANQTYMTGSYRAVVGRGSGSNDYWDYNPNATSLPGNWRGGMHVTWPSGPGRERISSISDGTSTTMAVVERATQTHTPRHTFWSYAHASYWSASPVNQSRILLNDYDACVAVNPGDDGPCKRGMSSFHQNGFNAVFYDGSVRYMDASIDLNLLIDLSTIAGGEAAPDY